MTDLKIKIDKLKLYFGEPYIINTPSKDITVYQPTIGDIMEMGEENFYSTVNVFIANSTMYRLQLWDLGIDWNDVSDFQIFSMLVTNYLEILILLLFNYIQNNYHLLIIRMKRKKKLFYIVRYMKLRLMNMFMHK